MKLIFSPIMGLPGAPETVASVAGDVLTVDGIEYDLSAVPEGGEAIPEGDHPFLGSITRNGGEIIAMLVWTYGPDAAAVQPADPDHWQLSVTSGAVPSPVVKAEPTADEEIAE